MATPHWPVPCLQYRFSETSGTTFVEDIAGEDLALTTGAGSGFTTITGGNAYNFAGTAIAKSTTRTATGPVYDALNGASAAAVESVYDVTVITSPKTRACLAGVLYGNPSLDDTGVLSFGVFDSNTGYHAGVRGTTTVDSVAITGTPAITTGLHHGCLVFDTTNASPRYRLYIDAAQVGTATLAASETLTLANQTAVLASSVPGSGACDVKTGWVAFFNERLSPGVIADRSAALLVDNDTAPAAPIIVWHQASAVAVTANLAGATVAPVFVYPPAIQSGDLLRCVIGQKPATANGGGVTMPTGSWTLGASLLAAGGYATTLGADTGNTNLYVFYKEADGTETGNCSDIACTDQNVTWAVIERFSKSSGTWDLAFTTGSQTAAGDLSITLDADPGVTADDYIAIAVCIPTDIGTAGARWDTETISQTGITFGTIYETTEVGSSNSNDIGGLIYRGRANSGTSSAAPAITANFTSGTTTNVRGPAIFMRMRASSSPTPPASTQTGNLFFGSL